MSKTCMYDSDSAPHRPVDKIVLSAASPSTKTAIVCPSLVYGQGRGPASQRSMQAYELTRLILERGAGFKIGGEDYMWFAIHLHDLSRLYLALVEAVVSGRDENVEQEMWNGKGYYIVESQEFRWNELANAITGEAYRQGFIKSSEAEILEGEEREKLEAVGVALWNVRSRAKSVRAEKVLGWRAGERGLLEEVPGIVAGEARRAGMT